MNTPEPETPTPVRIVVPEPGGFAWYVQHGQQLNLPGGEIEIGESLVEGVQRIVAEQIGLHVEIERWLGDLGVHYLMARPIDGTPRANAIKLPIERGCRPHQYLRLSRDRRGSDRTENEPARESDARRFEVGFECNLFASIFRKGGEKRE